MTQQVVKGSLTVRFIQNADQCYLTRNIVRVENGVEYGASLFQAIDATSGTLSVDWTVAKNQPIIKIGAGSAQGYPTSINSVLWAYDGNTLSFGATADGDGWYTDTTNRFQRRITSGIEELRIIANLASKDNSVISNKQITYTVDYTCNAVEDKITNSVDVLIQQAGTDSHSVNISTPHVELSADVTSTVLTAECLYGTNAVTVGQNGYTMKWLQDGVEMSGQTGQTLTVTRDMVDGGSIFTVGLFRNGTLVATDGQRVNDTADTYQIKPYTPDGCNDALNLTQNATFAFKIYKNGVEQTVTITAIEVDVYNALGVKTATLTTNPVVITADMAKCTLNNSNSYYGDISFIETITF